MKMNAVLATPFRVFSNFFRCGPRPADGGMEVPIIMVTGLPPKAAAASQRSPFPIITVTGLSPTAPPQPSPTAKSIASASGTFPDGSSAEEKTLEDVILGLCEVLLKLGFLDSSKTRDIMPFRSPNDKTKAREWLQLVKTNPSELLKEIKECDDPVLVAFVLKNLLGSSRGWYDNEESQKEVIAAFGIFQTQSLGWSRRCKEDTLFLSAPGILGTVFPDKEGAPCSKEGLRIFRSWLTKSPDTEQPKRPLTPSPSRADASAGSSDPGSPRSSISLDVSRPGTPVSLDADQMWSEAEANVARAEAEARPAATKTLSGAVQPPGDVDARMSSDGARPLTPPPEPQGSSGSSPLVAAPKGHRRLSLANAHTGLHAHTALWQLPLANAHTALPLRL